MATKRQVEWGVNTVIAWVAWYGTEEPVSRTIFMVLAGLSLLAFLWVSSD